MTRLSGFGDDGARGTGDALPLALRIADAVESLAHLWATAGQGASLRLSLHQLKALRILESGPGLNLTALAEGMEIGLPTASRLCDRLEAAGLVERALHPHRRREVQLHLTGHGRQVLHEVASNRSHALAAVLAAMHPAEREALGRGMRAFLTAHKSTSDGGGPPAAGPDGAGRSGNGPGYADGVGSAEGGPPGVGHADGKPVGPSRVGPAGSGSDGSGPDGAGPGGGSGSGGFGPDGAGPGGLGSGGVGPDGAGLRGVDGDGCGSRGVGPDTDGSWS